MMKNIILLGSFFFFVVPLMAQQKYGHISSQEILVSMPEYKQMMTALEKRKNEQSNRLNAMYKDYQRRQKELTDYGAGLMEAVREEKLIEMDSLEKAITAYQESMDADLQSFQGKLLQPLNDKYLKIVAAVAKENGYSYIFDINTGSVAYYPEKNGNITDLVKKKMGITQ